MAPKNSEQVENFKQTVLTKIKDSIKLTDTTSIKEIGHSYDEFSRALDYYSEDSDISSLLVYIDDNIKRIQNNTKPELKLQEVDGIDEQKFLEFFKLSNKQFLWKMNQKVQEAKPLNKEKIKQIMQSLKPHQNKVKIWTHMELPVHPEMDTACFIKHYQAHIMISSNKVSEEITDIQSRASAKMKEIIRGDYKNEFDEEPLKEHLDHTRASLS
uniref:Uncharacterized protein n=1 Tax=Euplotes crassus TaxID=5936 RepID=A0A7S3P0R3_EUPCR|mmetsp:Transcript_521/g.519  ORF Transcript_521/g.519 Transcript_521/m.519 type:complete len:213 (+) Transcript_521:259-897(+)